MSVPPSGTILTVGPAQQYSTIASAIAASRNGDTILVQAGTYTNDFATITTDITLQGVDGMVNMVCTEEIPNGKAILVTQGNDTISNVSFSGAQVRDQNGAGIRYEAGNLILNNDYFHDNEEGLLSSSNPSGALTINNSEFGRNGVGDGFTHNLYVGQLDTLTVNNSYFHDAAVGHEVKSRAANTIIENSRVQDGPAGTASYSIDLPNGGNALIRNNVIEQGPLSQNSIIISSGEEGNIYASSSLQVLDNIIINDLASSSALAINNRTSATAEVSRNDFYRLASGQIAAGPSTQSDNTFLNSEPALIVTSPWASPVPDTNLSIFDTTTNQALPDNGAPYTGPVQGIRHEYVYARADSINVSVSDDDWFLHGGPGDDALAAFGGYNVLDGGTGSDFLSGGSGHDTFFVDDRSPPADIWSTVNGFHAGDDATVFGIVPAPNNSNFQWADNQGATGFSGLTLHVFTSGAPTASLTLPGYGTADLSNGRLAVGFGTEPDGTPFMHIIGSN